MFIVHKIPKFWRKFKRLMTVQDLIMKRKVVVETHLDDDSTHYSIERVKQ